MKKRNLIGHSIAVSSLALLTACGGGGGDKGNGGNTGPTLSLDPSNYASKEVEISSTSNIDNFTQLSADMNDAFILIDEIYESLWYQSDWELGTADCDGGGTFTVTFADQGSNYDESWEFSNCVVSTYSYGDVLLNGTFRYVDNLTNSTETTDSWKGYETYDITGELKDIGEPLVVKGRITWDDRLRWDGYSDSPVSGWSLSTIDALEFKVGNSYIALTNTKMRFEWTDADNELALDGTLVGSAIMGHVQISTPTPVQISDYDTCPTEGVTRLSSNGSAEVRYGSSAAGTAGSVAVWVDGQIVKSYSDCRNAGLWFF